MRVFQRAATIVVFLCVSVCFCEVEGLCVFCVNTPGFTFAKVVLCACDSVCKCVCARTRMRAWVVLSKLIK